MHVEFWHKTLGSSCWGELKPEIALFKSFETSKLHEFETI